MSPISQPTFTPGTTTLQGATEPKITHLSITNANTEYSHVLVNNLKQLRIRCEQMANLKYAFVQNESGTKGWSVYKGTCDNISDLSFTGKTLYIQSDKASVIIEIMELF